MSDFQTGLDLFSEEVPDRIILLDTETTGLDGAMYERDPGFRPAGGGGSRLDSLDWNRYGDLVLDIGMCEISLSRGTVRDLYSSVVGYDTDRWNDRMRGSWIFSNSDMTLEDVRSAPRLSKVVSDAKGLLGGRWVTSYNIQYDMDKFLYRFPWNLRGAFREVRDPMFSAAEICKLKNQYYGMASYRYPKLEYAYETILGGEDPAGIRRHQDHRALSDARMASHVLLRMYRDGMYDPLDFTGRHSSLRPLRRVASFCWPFAILLARPSELSPMVSASFDLRSRVVIRYQTTVTPARTAYVRRSKSTIEAMLTMAKG